MNIKNSIGIALTGLLVGATALVGCQQRSKSGEERSRQELSEQQGEPTQQQQGQEQGQQEGMIDESIEPVGGTEVGGTATREGQTEVQAERRVLEREIVEYQIPTVEMCEQRVDINEMEAKHFQALGISQSSAQQIVQYREQNGPFNSVSELQNVPGIDSQALSKLQSMAGVGSK